jgi:nitroimidazol reductase NimA-like FMN-containing flavoprotein (pyridoxamine 5'-phosphate oxidase superfamily)
MILVMDARDPALEQLSRAECMRLMRSVPVGRIIYTRQALPAVDLVNFALVDGDIVIRTSAAGRLAAATRGAVVAFEADSVDPAGSAGWSVTVVGQARAVTDDTQIRSLERVALASWLPGERDHFIRIAPSIVNGRRVGGPLPARPRRRDVSYRNPPPQPGARARGGRLGRAQLQLAPEFGGADSEITQAAAPAPGRDPGAVIGHRDGEEPGLVNV